MVDFNFFMKEVPIIKKPVHWFAKQINGLASKGKFTSCNFNTSWEIWVNVEIKIWVNLECASLRKILASLIGNMTSFH